jgi:hypothetical protein
MARKFELRGKTALVTGASSGIGRALAEVLARDVGTLVLVARRRDRLDALAKELTGRAPSLRVIVRDVDLTDRAAAGAMIDALEAEGVAIDVLVNNAGFGDRGPIDERPWAKLEALLELNVVSFTWLVHRLLPGMIARGSGAIMLVGSIAGIAAKPGSAVYGASKSYVNGLGEALHAELSSLGLFVTTVLPGPVPTEFGALAAKTDAEPVDERWRAHAAAATAAPSGPFKLPNVLVVSAEQCAEEAVAALVRGQARVVTGAGVKAFAAVMDNLPRPLLRATLARAAARLRR